MSEPQTPIAYRVKVAPERREIDVTITIDGPFADSELRVATPTWVPGDYSFATFGRDVFWLRAVAHDGAELQVLRDGWQGHLIRGAGERVQLSYTACCSSWPLSEACGVLSERGGVLTGARYLFLADGSASPAQRPVVVAYELPAGWEVHHPSGARQLEQWTWEYPSYEILLDTPVAIGAFDLTASEVRGTPFYFVWLDRALGFERLANELVEQVDAVAAHHHDMFGSFPFDSYTFVLASNANAEWGLEHLTSTMIGVGPEVFTDQVARDTAVRACAHELFHAWNVRRLRPAPLGELDLCHGSFTDGLWVAEGFTRYYEFLTCTRTGVYTPAQFFSTIVNYYRHLVVRPAYERVAAVDASYASYLNHSERFAGRINDTIDYYDKGMLIAFSIDVALRSEAADASLDSTFAAFYHRYAGRGSGYTLQEVCDFFETQLPGLGEWVLRIATRPGGLEVVERLRQLGFAVGCQPTRYLGLILLEDTGPAIADVLDNSPASAAGVASEDVIAAVDGRPFELAALKWATDHLDTVELELLGDATQRTCEIRVGSVSVLDTLSWQGGEQQARLIAEWLRRSFAPAQGERIPLDFYQNFHGTETVI